MTIPELFLLEFDEEAPATRRMLERVPEASFSWQPHEKSMTLGRLSSHVAELPARCATIITTEHLRPPATVPRPGPPRPPPSSSRNSTKPPLKPEPPSSPSAKISSPPSGPSKWATAPSPPCPASWRFAASSWTTSSTIVLSSASSCVSSTCPSPALTVPPPTISAEGRFLDRSSYRPNAREPASRLNAVR